MSFSSTQVAQASLISQIGGGITSAIGGYYSAVAQKSALNFNAKMADLQARGELEKGQHEVARLTMKAGQVKSAQRAAMAANGIDLGVGNAAEVQASTEILKEIDKNTLEANAIRSAWGYQVDALMGRAKASTISPFGAAAGTLLTSAGSVADSWYKFKQSGAFDSATSTVTIGGG